jgi:beta-lactamase regulating signal transducer with metallopeptidase domain
MSNPPLDPALVQSIGWALIHFIWQGALIGAFVAIALRALIGTPPTTRYSVCCIGLTSMFLAPVWSIVTRRSVNDVNFVAVAAKSIDSDLSAADRLLSVAVVVWSVGVLLLSIRLVASCIGIERLKRVTSAADVQIPARVQSLSRRLGIRRSVQVFESALVQVPTIVGWLRPIILLPVSVASSLPVSHLDAVIAHELAHVRRHDYLVNALQSIVETLLFYHPAVWWCSRQIRIEREHCCDDLVVEACGNRVAYATALARLEELRGVEPMLSLNMTGGRLVDRIRRLLSERSGSARTPLTCTIATAFAIAVAAIIATPALTTADEAGEAQDRFDIALQVEQVPDVPLPPTPPPLAPAPPMVPAVPAPPAPPALPQLPAVPAGPVVPDAPAVVALPAVPDRPALPYSPRLLPATPAPPAPSAPPAPPGAPALLAPAPPAPPLATPVPPAPLAVPAPPAPPTLFLGQVGVGGDDASELARELTDASQRLLGGFDELRKAAQDVAQKQMQLQMAQAEVEKVRAAALGTNAQIAAMQKALGELAAKGALLKDLKPQIAEMQKQIEAMRKSIEEMRSR